MSSLWSVIHFLFIFQGVHELPLVGYYPFGKQRSLLAGSIENKYLYNGKENPLADHECQ